MMKILPAPVPVPWTPGATHLDGGSVGNHVFQARMVQTPVKTWPMASYGLNRPGEPGDSAVPDRRWVDHWLHRSYPNFWTPHH
jgi:hypothetical protein